jgi:hypothetical protein
MRMSRVIFLGLVGGAILPTLAVASDQNINVSSEVAKFCRFDGIPTIESENNMQEVSSSAAGSTIEVSPGSIVNGLQSSSGHGFAFVSHATCNTPSKVRMQTANGGVKHDSIASPPSGFHANINYSASVFWGTFTPLGGLVTSGVAGEHSLPNPALSAAPREGTLTVSLFFVPDTVPLVAGNYTDTLTVSVEPQ